MKNNVSLERMIASAMADEVGHTIPDGLLDEVLASTSRRRPAPRWLALLKEPSMRVQSQPAVGLPARRLILALGLVLLIAAIAAAAVGASLLMPRPVTASADWPMFRGDATRAGVAAEGPTGRPILRWRYQASGAVSDSISIVGDMVFVGSDDGVMHALGLADGAERWTAKGFTPPVSGPTVANGLVYLSDGGGAVAALESATGQQRWRSTSVYQAPSNSTADKDIVSFGTADGLLVALDAGTGAERWRSTIASSGSVHAPAIAGGLVYASSDNGGYVAVDVTTGKLAWRLATGTDQTGTAIVVNGIAYIGASADTTTGGHLRAVDAKTGAILWQADGMSYSPAISAGIAFSSTMTGAVIARDAANGAEHWRFQVKGLARAPAVSAGVVYFSADTEHRVYALDAVSGRELWQFDVDGANNCCIAIAHGSVFVGTSLGGVYDIGGDRSAVSPMPAQSLLPSLASAPSSEASPSVVPSVSPAPSPVSFTWKANDPTTRSVIPTSLTFDPHGQIWAADTPKDRFAIFKPDGTFVEFWGTSGSGRGQLDLTRTNGDPYGAVAFEPDGSYFVLDVGHRLVQKFDAKRQFVLAWGGFGTGPGKYSDPVGIAIGPDGKVNVLDDVRAVIETYDRDGKVLGSIPAFATVGSSANGLAMDSHGDFYVSQIDPEQVTRIDPAGKVLMTFGAAGSGPGEFHEQPTQMAIDATGRVYVTQGPQRGDYPGVQVFSPDGGFLAGWGAIGSADGDLTFPWGVLLDGKGNVYVADFSGRLGLEAFSLLPPLKP